MANNTNIGGFVSFNSGTIKDCYSVLKIKSKNNSGGFVYENKGDIFNSYSYGDLKSLKGGFATVDNGNTESNCYFIHSEKQGSKRLQNLPDNAKAVRVSEINSDDNVSTLGFDVENVWSYFGNEIPIGFNSEKWFYDYTNTDKETIIIKTADDLITWRNNVNSEDKQAISAYVVLESDIDLGGKEWNPIGESRNSAFSGVFDGKGHSIKNFVMKDKKIENKGFFGFLNGDIYNLSIDCEVDGGSCVGALVSQNSGKIGCCSAVVKIKNKQGSVGGLVGRNTGEIFQSYVAGTIVSAIIPIWIGIPPLALVLIYITLNNSGLLPTFAPVPYDDDAVPIPNETLSPTTDGNFVAFQFQQEIKVDSSTGLCKFEFKNPGNSTHNIVVQLQFTDGQAIRVMGSTGRSSKEQSRLESIAGYDPEAYRTVIAESGAIRPGYQLDDLRLVTHDNGATIPAGKYNAVVYLIFYDVDTNNRAMLESQLPVVIEVN